jgi:hypothetical protein
MRDDGQSVVDRRKKELLGRRPNKCPEARIGSTRSVLEDKGQEVLFLFVKSLTCLRQTRSDIPSSFVGLQRKKGAVVPPTFYLYAIYTGIV